MKTRYALFTLVSLLFSPLIGAANSIVISQLSAPSGGRRIEIEKYTGATTVNARAIVVLHGAGGTLFDGPEMRRVAQRLAGDGNSVYLVHYFNRTGTIFGLDAGMQRNFGAWLETVRDCIKFVQKDHGDNAPVGIYGYSLGAFLALAAASDNASVGAVVEQAGGIWNGKEDRIQHMPPVLIVHGEADARVPFQKYAQPLARVLRQRGARFETSFLPGEGHGLTAKAMAEVRDSATKFFRQNLR